MADYVTWATTTPDTTASVQKSGQETSAKLSLKSALWSVLIGYVFEKKIKNESQV